jgi:regulator of cell morphogenesis and NO signaling
MYRLGRYRRTDKMSDLICENYSMLLVMSRFGIPVGFGDLTIEEVCTKDNVDVRTFLTVVNLLICGEKDPGEQDPGMLSIPSLITYLKNSHTYFLGFRLPTIRSKLIEVLDSSDSQISTAIIRFYDEYVEQVKRHMEYEEQTLFPYIDSLLAGKKDPFYQIKVFCMQHDQIDAKLSELKNIIIKYYSSGNTNELNSVLFDIFSCSGDLASHNFIEDHLLVPEISRLERNVRKK